MEKEKNRFYLVENIVNKILFKLNKDLSSSQTRANLAGIRNSINKPLSNAEEVWPILFESLPEEFLSKDGSLTAEENAILLTLQLYAIHQQGSSISVLMDENEDNWKNLGYSLNSLRKGDDSLAIDRRFNTMITSSTFDELSHHLRQLIKLLKAKSDVKINYGKLAKDLYGFIRGNRENVRISWAQRYYSYNKKENKEGENTNEK